MLYGVYMFHIFVGVVLCATLMVPSAPLQAMMVPSAPYGPASAPSASIYQTTVADNGRTAVRYHGYATIYPFGLMGHVATKRGMPWVDCMIASPLYGLGAWVHIRSEVTSEVVDCRVTDVPEPYDRATQLANRAFVEFDAATGLRMCAQDYPGQEPRWACPVTVWR